MDSFASARPRLDRSRCVLSECCRHLAQNGPDYRALVCVFLFGGNDSNNTVIPMDDANFQAYTSIRGSLALAQSALTPTVYTRFGRALRVSWEAGRSRQSVFVEGAGGGRKRRLAGAAADARAVSGAAGAYSAESFFSLRSAIAVADIGGARSQPHRVGRPRGRLHRVAEHQFLEVPDVLFRCREQPGRHGSVDAAGRAGARRIAAARRIQFQRRIRRRGGTR